MRKGMGKFECCPRSFCMLNYRSNERYRKCELYLVMNVCPQFCSHLPMCVSYKTRNFIPMSYRDNLLGFFERSNKQNKLVECTHDV